MLTTFMTLYRGLDPKWKIFHTKVAPSSNFDPEFFFNTKQKQGALSKFRKLYFVQKRCTNFIMQIRITQEYLLICHFNVKFLYCCTLGPVPMVGMILYTIRYIIALHNIFSSKIAYLSCFIYIQENMSHHQRCNQDPIYYDK